MSNRLDGKVAIVTGGASGIGAATVALFLERGASVLAFDRNAQGLAGLAPHARLATWAGDVAQEPEVAAAVAEAQSRFGGLDIMVNNAAVEIGQAPLAEASLADLHSLLSVNVGGVFNGIKHAIPALAARGGGAIVNTGSMNGLVGVPYQAAYSASKAAVHSLTKTVAGEVRKQKIRINCVAPGGIQTPFFDSVVASNPGIAIPSGAGRMGVARIGQPQEVAAVIGFLASDEASYVTGAIYSVDGGYTAL